MLLEKSIEDRILAAIRALQLGDGVSVEGSWEAVADGEVKGMERHDESACVAVATSGPAFDSFESPVANISATIVVTIRRELAPTAAEVAETLEPIAALLVRWNADYGVMTAELSSSEFQADGVRLDAGDPPVYDSSRSIWAVTRSFTVRGTVNN